jgi:hypothetical protein
MPNYQIVPATQEHVAAMLPNVRQADRDEVLASSGLPMDQVLGKCVSLSEMSWAGLIDGQVACLFGVRGLSMLSIDGVPWMIATDLIEAHAKPFLRRSGKVVQVMLDRYPHLANFVDVRNTKAKQWLEWLGFTLHEPVPHGPYQMPFHPFDMKENHV